MYIDTAGSSAFAGRHPPRRRAAYCHAVFRGAIRVHLREEGMLDLDYTKNQVKHAGTNTSNLNFFTESALNFWSRYIITSLEYYWLILRGWEV